MKPRSIRKLLMREIEKVSESVEEFCLNPGTDFTRNRKIPVDKLMLSIIGMESGNLTNELLDCYDVSPDTPTASAFVQQRLKLKPEAFETVFHGFSQKINKTNHYEIPIFAVDGSDIPISADSKDDASFFPGTNGQKPYGLLHLNALYDLNHRIYVDAVLQKRRDFDEHAALVSMVDKSPVKKAIIIADRGYEAYNNMAHIQEKGWSFLIRIKDGKTGIKDGFSLPTDDLFDVDIHLKLTRRQTKEVKKLMNDRNHYRVIPANTRFDYLPKINHKHDPVLFYDMHFRMVRFQISDGIYETIVTNLNRNEFPPSELKRLYSYRWGIETSFRDLKYTVGLLDFHSKKVACIQQEIYARLIMYNFAEMITSQVSIRKKPRKHVYKANFSVAVHMCRLYYREKVTLPVLETIIAKNLVPIRPNRHRERNLSSSGYHSFLYRVA